MKVKRLGRQSRRRKTTTRRIWPLVSFSSESCDRRGPPATSRLPCQSISPRLHRSTLVWYAGGYSRFVSGVVMKVVICYRQLVPWPLYICCSSRSTAMVTAHMDRWTQASPFSLFP